MRLAPPVPSSVIRSIEYLPAQRELRIVFQSGRRYRYQRVPAELYAEMQRAFSKGEFFNAHIRDRFPFTREDAEA